MKINRIIAFFLSLIVIVGMSPLSCLAEGSQATTSQLTETQLNSLVMLNYLTVLTEEINSSSNSRLYLEEAYNNLFNNTNSRVDKDTQYYFTNLLQTLNSYRMIDVKRERLEYIYEQNKAQALRSAVPNPLGLMSAVQSFSMKKLVSSIIYMAVDSYSSYQSASAEADLEYLKAGWDLDDASATTLNNSQEQLFNYIFDTAREYDIPDELTLRQNQVKELVKYENNQNVIQRIQFLEDEQASYQAYGRYWLILAKSYFENGDYAQCLKAVEQYESLGVSIFRRDYDYAQILPLAICAMEETNSQQYNTRAAIYAKAIEENTENDDWDLRYFAAQTYISLYTRTKDENYLTKAYELIRKNIVHLVDEQRRYNEVFLGDITEVDIPDGATKETKREIKQYNKMLKESRKTELPPVFEPLLLNCDLLFALAGQLNLPQSELKKIEGILHPNGDSLFLCEPINTKYSISANNSRDYSNIDFDGEKLVIPATFLSASSRIRVTVYDGSGTAFDDWTVKEVERKSGTAIETFSVVYTSQSIKKHKYTADSVVMIEIIPAEQIETETIAVKFATTTYKKVGFFTRVKFGKVDA